MKKYKPEYLGKVLPKDQDKITDFMHNKFNGFSEVYNTCKDSSDKINDVKSVEKDTDNKETYAMKVSADDSVLKDIKEKNTNQSIDITGDTITYNK